MIGVEAQSCVVPVPAKYPSYCAHLTIQPCEGPQLVCSPLQNREQEYFQSDGPTVFHRYVLRDRNVPLVFAKHQVACGERGESVPEANLARAGVPVLCGVA